MSKQLNLFDSFKTEADRKFEEYHGRNPHIFSMFVKLTGQLKNKGQDYYGAKAVFEIIRWKTLMAGDDCLKINNNYTSRYVRLLERKHPRFKDFYRKRRLKT